MKKSLVILAVMSVLAIPCFAQYSTGIYPSVPSVSAPSVSVPTITVPTTTVPTVRYQSGYTRSDGTYVNGHYKTTTNRTNHDNFSTQGNINIYTGTQGSRARDYSPGAFNYGVGQTIRTGSRGGQYYINSHGNKTYVPKRR